MPRLIDKVRLQNDLRVFIQSRGVASAAEICSSLGISQPLLSRVVSQLQTEILVVGKARSTRYALIRDISRTGRKISLYEVGESGKISHAANFIPIFPKGFCVEFVASGRGIRVFNDLPYFLDDLRPTGFLGRLIPKQYPQLEAPSDITKWSVDDCLRYLSKFSWNSIGNFIVGDEALKLYLQEVQRPQSSVDLSKRSRIYPRLAEEILSKGPGGSSAGGEQPKFMSMKGERRIPVIVKFSPLVENKVAERLSDLLIAEHLAHLTLDQSGKPAARSEIIFGGGRTFLEVERFDRAGVSGRKGLVSLAALDGEFVGEMKTWTASARVLAEQKIISVEALQQTQWLEFFGHLIGNTDMHLGNLSFYFEKFSVQGLAPTYDMLPMAYTPRNQEISDVTFEPPLPSGSSLEIWGGAITAAQKFWALVENHSRVSKAFKAIAKSNQKRIQKLDNLARILP